MRTLIVLLLAAGAALVLSCATGPTLNQAESDLAAGDVDAAVEKLEEMQRQRPGDMDVWEELVKAHFLQWRGAEDAGRDQDAVQHLADLQAQILEMVEYAPDHPSPHTWMGIVAAYRNDLDGALENFQNARVLEPRSGNGYTNLAHVWVYKGRLSRATPLLDRARDRRASPSEIDRVEILAAWRRGDFVEARDVFEMALDVPDFADSWDMVPLEKPMESFEDFAAVCCANKACGPNMGNACGRLDLEVNRRKLDAEAVREEMRLEIERRKRLRSIYEDRGDLGVEVQTVPEEAPEQP